MGAVQNVLQMVSGLGCIKQDQAGLGSRKGIFPLSPGTKITQARDSSFPLAFKKPRGMVSSGSREGGSAHPAWWPCRIIAEKSLTIAFYLQIFPALCIWGGEGVLQLFTGFIPNSLNANPLFNNHPGFLLAAAQGTGCSHCWPCVCHVGVLKFLPEPRKTLELGCAFGFWLFLLKTVPS